jgi:hypothetical protein
VTKTQIQVPEELFAEIREFARKREWSLAETFRRGAELLLQTYPHDALPATQAWQPPSSGKAGWKGLNAEQLRALSFDEEHGPLASP